MTFGKPMIIEIYITRYFDFVLIKFRVCFESLIFLWTKYTVSKTLGHDSGKTLAL